MDRAEFQLRPSITVDTAGKPLRLVLTMRALLAFEEQTGVAFGSKSDPRAIRALLWALTREYHEQVRLMTINDFWTLDQIPNVIEQVIPIFKASVPDLDPKMAKVKAVDTQTRLTQWESLWAIGRVDLHLSEAEFWSLTPRMFHELVKRVTVETGENQKPLSEEDEAAILLEKVVGINRAMGGIDLRKNKEAFA